MKLDSYKIINIILAGIFGMIFIYSSFFSATKNDHPVQCQFELTYNKPCPTCGISRAFSEIMRLRFEEAKLYNRYSLQIFSFFLIQFLFRFVLIVFAEFVKNKQTLVISIDIIIFVSTILIVFLPIYFKLLFNFF